MAGEGDATAIPYERSARRADRKRGGHDGRRQQPPYGQLAGLLELGEPIAVPYLDELIRHGRHAIHQEYLRFLHRTTENSRLIRTGDEQLALAQDQVRLRERAVEQARTPVTDADLEPRNHMETTMSATALRGRRVAARERRIADAERAYTAAVAAKDEIPLHLAAERTRIEQEFATAQTRALKVDEFYRLRMTTYWGGVADRHPEGVQLALLLPRIVPGPPDWVTGAAADLDDSGRWSPAPKTGA
jgi:hypothetical protein